MRMTRLAFALVALILLLAAPSYAREPLALYRHIRRREARRSQLFASTNFCGYRPLGRSTLRRPQSSGVKRRLLVEYCF